MTEANLRRLLTALRSGIRGVQAAPVVFSTSVATMAAGLVLLGAYMLLVQNMRGTIGRLGDEFSIYAYLPPKIDPTPEQVRELQDGFLGISDIRQVTFVSRADALEQLKADLGELGDVLDELGDNPLPASFELQVADAARSPERIEALAQQIEQVGGIDEARYGEQWVGMYARLLRTAEVTGLVLGLGLFLVLSVIVGGTVRLAVYARADEIEIQRLVGAGGLYVRLPFYIQGALQGGLGAVLATLLLYGLYQLDALVLGGPLRLLTGAGGLRFFGPLEISFLLLCGTGLGIAGAMIWLFRLEETG